jgi:hypothetical protein
LHEGNCNKLKVHLQPHLLFDKTNRYILHLIYMPKLTEKGIIHIATVVIILLIGLGALVVLVKNPAVFKSFANGRGTMQCNSTPLFVRGVEICPVSGNDGLGFSSIEYYCTVDGLGRKQTASGECQTFAEWSAYATTQCANICNTSNNLSPSPSSSNSPSSQPSSSPVASADYSCSIRGPSTVTPGQQVTFFDESTSNVAAIDRWSWGSKVGSPAISWVDNQTSFNWTAPITPGVYPEAISHAIHVPGIDPTGLESIWTDSCAKTITVSGSQEWSFCSYEGSTSVINGQDVGAYCRFEGTATVRYGREPVWYTKTGVADKIACNSQTFGYPPNLPDDPNHLKVKHCEYKLD